MSIQDEILKLEEQIFNDDTITQNQVGQSTDDSKEKIKRLILFFLSTYKNPTKKQYQTLFDDISKELSTANKTITEEIKKRLDSISASVISEMVKIYAIEKAIADKIKKPAVNSVWGDLVEPWDESLKYQIELANKKIQLNVKSNVALKNINGAENLISPIDKTFSTLKNSTSRIIRSESTRIRGDTNKNIATAAGYTRFRYVAVLDSRTSEICRSMNGKIFPMSAYQIGVTVPPLHYFCRSSIVLLK